MNFTKQRGKADNATRRGLDLLVFASPLALLASALPCIAHAQTNTPPVFQTVDGNGVDVPSGRLAIAMEDVSIGPTGAGGLSFVRTLGSNGWRHNYAGTIVLDTENNKQIVSTGDSSENFTSFDTDQRMGSTLSYDSGTKIYTYTLRDGTVALFDGNMQTVGFGGQTTGGYAAVMTSLTRPNGERLTFHYKQAIIQGDPRYRLQSVTNNRGYQLHFEYANNNPITYADWFQSITMTRVTAINNAVDYCDPLADSCTGMSATWPSVTYALSGTTETTTDALGRVTRLTYAFADHSQLTAIRRPSSSSTDHITIGYNAGRVSTVSNGVGTWTYFYSETTLTRTAAVHDPLSHIQTYVSTWLGQLDTYTDGAGRTTQFGYSGTGPQYLTIYPQGNRTELTRDVRGNILQTTQIPKSGSGLSNIVTTASFPTNCTNPVTCNLPTSSTDARGNTTDFTYDSTHGGVLTITQPDPDGGGSAVRPQTRFTYASLSAYYKNSSGTVVAAPAPITLPTETSACATMSSCAAGADETKTTITYGTTGVANNLLPTITSSGAGNGSLTATTTMAYDTIGNTLTVDGPLSGSDDTTRFRFDTGRQLVGIAGPDPDGGGGLLRRAVRLTYNLDGQVTMTESGTVNGTLDSDWTAFASLQQRNVSYDFQGRATTQTLTSGATTYSRVQTSYDAAGRVDCVALRMNLSASPTTAACTLNTEGTFGPDRITHFSYNNADQTTQVTNGYGTSTQLNEWTANYTNNGQVQSLTDAAGNVTTNEYDGVDRLVKIRFPNTSGGGSSTTDYEQYTYDAASNVTASRRRSGDTFGYTYDALNRRITLDYPGETARDVTYDYDNFSRLTSESFSGHALLFTYDQLSRNLTQTSPLGTVTYQYDIADRRTRITWPDSFYVVYDYNLANNLTAVRENGATSGPGVLATFGYNDLGSRTSVARGNGTNESATFDGASQLETLTQNLSGSAQDVTFSYTYNPAGQQITRTVPNPDYRWTPSSPTGATYTDNGLNQYTSVNATSYSYDTRGNLTSTGTATYGYDLFNQLISGPGSTSLTYDPWNRIYQVSASGSATRFLYDGAQIIAEYDGSNSLQRRFVPGLALDEPLVWYEGTGTGDRRTLLSDDLGSIIAVTNSSAVATTINKYDEYGLPAPGNTGRFQFAGAPWLSQVSLTHLRARAYAPWLGRFMQTDPVLTVGGMNIYAYAGNDPVNLTDPAGLCTGSLISGRDCAGISGYAGPGLFKYGEAYADATDFASGDAAQRSEDAIAVVGRSRSSRESIADALSLLNCDAFCQGWQEIAGRTVGPSMMLNPRVSAVMCPRTPVCDVQATHGFLGHVRRVHIGQNPFLKGQFTQHYHSDTALLNLAADIIRGGVAWPHPFYPGDFNIRAQFAMQTGLQYWGPFSQDLFAATLRVRTVSPGMFETVTMYPSN